VIWERWEFDFAYSIGKLEKPYPIGKMGIAIWETNGNLNCGANLWEFGLRKYMGIQLGKTGI
jgi:hypothetical protein